MKDLVSSILCDFTATDRLLARDLARFWPKKEDSWQLPLKQRELEALQQGLQNLYA
jgi:hypothetical protein